MQAKRKNGAQAQRLRRCVVLATLLSTAFAVADDAAVIQIDYDAHAPPLCPGAGAFADQLTARNHGVRVTTTTGAGVRMLVVRIDAQRARLVGHLTVREVDGTENERTVAGDTCAEVVAGLAFVAAVALTHSPAPTSREPQATAAVRAAQPGPSAPTPSAEAEPVSTGRASDKDGARTAAPDTKAGSASSRRASERTEEVNPLQPIDAAAKRWGLSIGGDGHIVNGAGPTTLVAVPVFAEIASTSRSLVAPSMRARFERASSARQTAAGGAEFTWTAGSIDLCPLAWSPGRFRNEACLRTEAGTMAGAGLGLQPVRTSVRPWLSVGPAVRGRWTLRSPLFLEIEGSMGVPLFRDRFFVQPNATVFRVPLFELGVAAGAGIVLW